MIDVKKYQVRTSTPQGQLTEAGFTFSEALPTNYGLVGWLGAALVPLFMVWMWAVMFKGGVLAWFFGLLLLAALVIVVREWRRNGRDESRLWFWRTVIFCRDGKIIVTPRNKGSNPALVPFPFGWDKIATIEPRPMRLTTGSQDTISHGNFATPVWEVNFHLRDGQTVQCARNLRAEDYAQLVAIQLNHAMMDMQASATFGGADDF